MRRGGPLTSCAVAAAVVLALTPAAAEASPATGGSATSQAAFGAAATIAPGALSPGTGLAGGALTALLQPVVDALTHSINATVSTAVTTLLNANANTADTSGGATSYGGAGLGVTVPGVLGVTLNGPSGSVTSTASAYSATASFADPQLSVLGLSVADLGVAQVAATCPTAGGPAPSASVALSGLRLFGGQVQAKIANGSNLLMVSLDHGATFAALSSLGTSLTEIPGTTLSARVDGTFLQVTQSIDLSTLLDGVGLGGLLTASGLAGVLDTSGTGLNLTLSIGPGTSPTLSTSTSATAWGLELGADLSGTIQLTELGGLGVLGATLGGHSDITIPTGIGGTSYGNLLDLKLAYATCTAATTAAGGTPYIPGGVR